VRVLMLSEPADGGVAEVVRQLALGLPKHGHEVEVAGPLSSPIYASLEATGTVIHRLALEPGLNRPWRDARLLRPVSALLRRVRPDVLHCHSAKAGTLGRLVAPRLGVPVVFSPHSWAFDVDYGGPRPRLTLAVERTLGPRSAAIVCVSENERRLAVAHRIAPPDRLHVVPNGTPPCDPEVSPDPALLALREGGPVAASVSALRPQKSLEVLLEAVPLVWERVPEARIAVVGNGPEREWLQELARTLGLTADPRFLMTPFEPPTARYLKASDVFVLSSSYEGLPLAVLEALACGVPQVVTDVGGTTEAVTPETGIAVPLRDPPALARAIAELLTDPGRRASMSQASRARHAERFALEPMVEATARVYDEVVGAAASG
jgi:glycosyltransferase involved in cell wall biosynthesis